MIEKDAIFNRILFILLVALYLLSLGFFLNLQWQESQEGERWMIALNGLIVSIPLVLFFGSIYVLVSAWRAHRLRGEVGTRMAKVIHTAPRLAAILIIFFVSLFSFDVFDMGGTILEQLGAFLMHSLPSIVLIILLVFAWRRPLIGFIVFLLAGLAFLSFVITGSGLWHFMLFSGPLLLIAGLFYADWRWLNSPPPTPLSESVEQPPSGAA